MVEFPVHKEQGQVLRCGRTGFPLQYRRRVSSASTKAGFESTLE